MKKIPIIAAIIICSLLALSSIPILQNNSIPIQEYKADFLFLQGEADENHTITDENYIIEFADENFNKVKIKLTKIKTPITITVKAAKIQPSKKEKFEFTTPIVAIGGKIEFETAKVTLPRNGKVDTIFKCKKFDMEKNECIGNWKKTKIQFSYILIEETVIDDKNGFVSYLTTPAIVFDVNSFSAYGGGIIPIIKAEHLNQEREFISDIFNEVKKKDNIWSETINANEYVRVTFAEELEQENDITVFARSVGEEAEIEIYRKDDDTLVAKIEGINEEGWHKVFLDGLGEEEKVDEFDLRVVGNQIEIDYIVDPTFDDFEDETVDKWTPEEVSGGTMTAISAAKKFGNFGARIALNGTTPGPVRYSNSDMSSATANVYLWFRTSDVSVTRGTYYRLKDESNKDLGGWYMNVDKIYFRWANSSENWIDSSVEVEDNTWYRLRMDYDGTNVSYYIYDTDNILLDSILDEATYGSGNADSISLQIESQGQVYNIDYDNVCYTDTEEPGPADSCSCPASGHWQIINGDVCTLNDSCNLSAGNLQIVSGSLTITNTGTLAIPSGYKAIIEDSVDVNMVIENGGKLIIHD